MVSRKRSSRIAVKESEREEQRAAARKKAEEDEKLSRARRAEARQLKEEADRLKREQSREQRRKEREAREAQEKAQAEGYAHPHTQLTCSNLPSRSEMQVDVVGDAPPAVPVARNGSMSPGKLRNYNVNGSTSGTQTPMSEDWELDCEICYRKGLNVVSLYYSLL